MSDADARDVIVDELRRVIIDGSEYSTAEELVQDNTDAILAALADAGYAVVRKSQILVDAFGQPESIEEVRPGVTMYTWSAEDDE